MRRRHRRNGSSLTREAERRDSAGWSAVASIMSNYLGGSGSGEARSSGWGWTTVAETQGKKIGQIMVTTARLMIQILELSKITGGKVIQALVYLSKLKYAPVPLPQGDGHGVSSHRGWGWTSQPHQYEHSSTHQVYHAPTISVEHDHPTYDAPHTPTSTGWSTIDNSYNGYSHKNGNGKFFHTVGFGLGSKLGGFGNFAKSVWKGKVSSKMPWEEEEQGWSGGTGFGQVQFQVPTKSSNYYSKQSQPHYNDHDHHRHIEPGGEFDSNKEYNDNGQSRGKGYGYHYGSGNEYAGLGGVPYGAPLLGRNATRVEFNHFDVSSQVPQFKPM